MGKKNRSTKKISDKQKAAMKKEGNFNNNQKKKSAAPTEEEDIDKIVNEIEREEARRQCVVEREIKLPFNRINFSLVTHPHKNEMIMFGGEYFTEDGSEMLNNLLTYNLKHNKWVVVKAPNAPPPRCRHQAVAVAANEGEMWIFGGEYTNSSGFPFFHYRDLWVYRMSIKKWEKITSPGGPSPRSGHRMISMKQQLLVFGGINENKNDRYYNDVYIFNLETYTWHQLETTGIAPAPRSECVMLPCTDKFIIYGGHSQKSLNADFDINHAYTDMFSLTPDENNFDSLEWRWSSIKQTGATVSPRYGLSSVLVQPNIAYIFGGAFEEDETYTQYYDDLLALDLEKFQWHNVRLSGKRHVKGHLKDENLNEDNTSAENHSDQMSTCNSSLTDSDNADATASAANFESPAPKSTVEGTTSKTTERIFTPHKRSNAGIVAKDNMLYLYGGLVADKYEEYALRDLYSLDWHKLDIWQTKIAPTLTFECASDSKDKDDDDDDADENDKCNS